MGKDTAPHLLIELGDALHQAVVDAACAGDRDWFAAHPRERVRHRVARPHEFCSETADQGCLTPWDEPVLEAGHRAVLWVTVRKVSSGARTRHPFFHIERAAA